MASEARRHVSAPARAMGALAAAAGCVGLFGWTTPAAATDLYVAGTIGEVYVGDSVTGGFEQFGGACLAPITALAMDEAGLYAGDINGGIITFDLVTGAFNNLYFMPQGVTAMLAHDGRLLVGEASGLIHHVDPATGTILSSMQAPWSVDAMHIANGELFVPGPEGSLWRGDPLTGNFTYFGCACAGTVTGIASDDLYIYTADTVGQLNRYDLVTGVLTWEGFMPFGGSSAMVMDGDALLLSEPGGMIHRLDASTFVEMGTMMSPVVVEAMLLDGPVQPCLADLDGSGDVGIGDLLDLLAAWGTSPGGPPDFDGGGVGITDLLVLLGAWGVCP